MHGIGPKLREARQKWGFTLREVEEHSTRIAMQWENPACRTSASWLDRVERNCGTLSATKLLVLAVVYGMSAEQMLSLCSHPSANPALLDQVSSPNATVLLPSGPREEHARVWLPEKLLTDAPPEQTTLLPAEEGIMPAHYSRGIIGRQDRTLEPMILAGSIVLIDTRKRSIAGRKDWTNEFDRPIYFLLTRAGYFSGFCELDKEAEWLTLVPHPLSYESSRRWRYKKEIEVVGTVAAVTMRRAA